MARTGSISHPGSIFDADAGGPLRGDGGNLGAQRGQVVVGRYADDGPDGQGLEAGPRAQGLGKGETLGPQLGVGDGHLEGGSQHPVGGRGPEELGHLRPRRQMPAPGGARPPQPGHAPIGGCSLDVVERGIDRRGVTEGGALAPSLALLSDDAHEQQRALAMHTCGGADTGAERQVDSDELDTLELHDDGAPTSSR